MSAACVACQLPILDQFMFHVDGKAWHQQCLVCVDCQQPMTETCFSRDGVLLCRRDFNRRYGTRCSGCDNPLDKGDLVRKARDKVFHLECFVCAVCRRKLDTGEQLYFLSDSRFVCQQDFLALQAPSPSTPLSQLSQLGSGPLGALGPAPLSVVAALPSSSMPRNESSDCGNSDEENNECNDEEVLDNAENGSDEQNKNENEANAKRRGPRTTIKAKQLETLKNAFATTPKPTRHVREQLAQETGLNMRVIQVWFQNRRSKERRMKQLRFGGYRPPRRSRNGREEICADVYAHDAAAAGFFPGHPMGFYCADLYAPERGLHPGFPLGPDGAPLLPQQMSDGSPVCSSPSLNQAALLAAGVPPPDFGVDEFRELPPLYTDVKPNLATQGNPMMSW